MNTTDFQKSLNVLAGTTGLDAQGAANVWAGTTQKDLLGALNAKAGTTGVGINRVCNLIAGTTGLDAQEALFTAASGEATPEFSVSYPTGLVGWYDASDTSTITESSGAVSQWNDKSATGANVIQGTAAAKPTTGTTTINSLNTLSFDGGDYLGVARNYGTLNESTVFIVGNSAVTTAGLGFFTLYGSDANDYLSKDGYSINTGSTGQFLAIDRGHSVTGESEVAGTGNTPSAIWMTRVNTYGLVEAFRNGGTSDDVAVYFQVWEPTDGGLLIGARWLSGAIAASNRHNGQIGEVLFYDNSLNKAEMNAVGDYLAAKWGFTWTDVNPAYFLMFEGDSLTDNTGGGTGYHAWVDAVLTRNWSIEQATGGETLALMAEDAATQIDAFYRPGDNNVLSIWGGTNDIVLNGTTGANLYTMYVAYCQARQAVGWQVLAYTILPRNAADPFETERQAFNTLVRANWATFADALVDPAANSNIGDAGDSDNTTYYNADKVHLNDTGRQIVAGLCDTALGTLGYI